MTPETHFIPLDCPSCGLLEDLRKKVGHRDADERRGQ